MHESPLLQFFWGDAIHDVVRLLERDAILSTFKRVVTSLNSIAAHGGHLEDGWGVLKSGLTKCKFQT